MNNVITNELFVQIKDQIHEWLSSSEGQSSLDGIRKLLDNKPYSLVDLGQCEFWRSYQRYLLQFHSRRKMVGELKILLREVGFECRVTSKGDWCGIAGKGDAYWHVSEERSAPIRLDRSLGLAIDDDAWKRIGLDGDKPSEVRAEIFRAFVLEKYGSKGEDNVLVCGAFKVQSGMSFTEFFGGLSVKKIKMEVWGESHCKWVPYVDGGITKIRVVPQHPQDGDRFLKMPRSAFDELVELVRRKVPEKIGFDELANRYGLTRETVLREYCSALKVVLTGNQIPSRDDNEISQSRTESCTVWRTVCAYFIRLGRALIGRGGPTRTRYLKKWARLLQGSVTQDAKVELDDGSVVTGTLLNFEDDCFMLKTGVETILVPISSIKTIKGIDRVLQHIKPTSSGENQTSSNNKTYGIGDEDTGSVTWWNEDRGFGFIKSRRGTCYFDHGLVKAEGLAEKLKNGYLGQKVRFSVVSEAVGDRYARVEVLKMERDGAYATGNRNEVGNRLRGNSQLLYLSTCPERDYVSFVLRTCDFHGLEDVGIQTMEDIPEDAAPDRGQTLRRMIEQHGKALEVFWRDKAFDDRKRYNDSRYNREMIRYQITGTGLLFWAGDDDKSRSAWRSYLYRKLQEMLFENETRDQEKAIAYLVMILRTLTTISNRYWEEVIPMLLLAIFHGDDDETIHKIVEDDEWRSRLLESKKIEDYASRRVSSLIVALGLEKRFQILARLTDIVPAECQYENYEEFRKSVVTKMDEGLTTLSVEGLESINACVLGLKIPFVGEVDYRAGLTDVVNAAISYIRADTRRKIQESYSHLHSVVQIFEDQYVLDKLSLPVVDIYYPCVCEIQRRVEADFIGKNHEKVKLELSHADLEKYYADDGVIEMRLKLISLNPCAPSICDISLETRALEIDGLSVRDCSVTDYFAGPLNGGMQGQFTVKLDLTDEEIKCGHGVLHVDVMYKYAEDDDVGDENYMPELAESFKLPFFVAEGVFEKIPNPYLNFIKKPATGSMFVGREKLLEEIVSTFSADTGGQGFVLYGQRRTGKTSVYENVKGNLGDENFVYTRISAHALEEKPGLESFSLALEDSIGNELDQGPLYVPDRSVKLDDYLGRIRHMSRAIAAGKGPDSPRTWVVGIDEFTSLYDYYHGAKGDDRSARKEQTRMFLRELKALLEERVFHLLIIGQESIVQLQRDFPNEFAVLHLHRLSYLQERDVKKLADDPIMKIRDDGERVSRFKGRALARLFYLTAGQPWFTQQFCKALVDYLNENRLHEISEGTIDAVEGLLCGGDTKIADAEFESFVNLMADIDEEEVVRLYYKIADETEEEYDWMPLSDFDERQIQIIHLLDARGIVRINNDSVQLRMGLFASWLRANPGRTRMSFGGKEPIDEN